MYLDALYTCGLLRLFIIIYKEVTSFTQINLFKHLIWVPKLRTPKFDKNQYPSCARIVHVFRNSFKDRFLKMYAENFGKFQENVYGRVYFAGLDTMNLQKKDSATDSYIYSLKTWEELFYASPVNNLNFCILSNFIRSVFRNKLKIYDWTFCKNRERLELLDRVLNVSFSFRAV